MLKVEIVKNFLVIRNLVQRLEQNKIELVKTRLGAMKKLKNLLFMLKKMEKKGMRTW
jgi:hypothetical protein